MSLNFFLRILFQYFLSGVLIFAARSTEAVEDLQTMGLIWSDVSAMTAQNILLGSGVFLSIIFTPFQLEREKRKSNILKNNLKVILQNHKKLFLEVLRRDLRKSTLHLNVRVFIPKRGLKAWYRKWRYNEIVLVAHNYDGFSETGSTEGLEFVVYPEGEKQGLVGLTYNSQSVCFDFNLKRNQNQYNLDGFQIASTNACEIGIAAPIFDKKKKNKVVAVITFDSEDRLSISTTVKNNPEWRKAIMLYCRFLHPYIPLLKKE